MIKLERGDAPEFLDEEKIRELTIKYTEDGSAVWNHSIIRESLLNLSNGKCAYCETNIVEESKYMEVDHFRCKSQFPEKVVEWGNLLPSCKRCNGRKGNYNVDVEGMIANPFVTDPREHMYFRNYRLKWRNEVGRRTITDVLKLNDSDRLVRTRMEIGQAIYDQLENIRHDLEEYKAQHQDAIINRRKWSKIERVLKKLLKEAQPESPFSALVATTLLTDTDYEWIKGELIEMNSFEEFEGLEESARNIMMA